MSDRRREGAEEEEEERSSAEEGEEEEKSEKALSSSAAPKTNSEPPQAQTLSNIPEAVDDFLRNFLRRAGLSRTLNRFEVEWYGSALRRLTDLKTAATAAPGVYFIPDALTHRHLLQSELEKVRAETELFREEVLRAGASLVRMQTERDFHRLQHQRVSEDKRRLTEDFKHLKKHLESYEPTLRQLEEKYQTAVRQKMLLSFHRERLQCSTDPTPAQVKEERRRSTEKPLAKTTAHPKDSEFPPCSGLLRAHLAQVNSHKGKSSGSFSLMCSIRAHQQPISCIDLHPRKLILVSASDDRTWRLWVLPEEKEKVGETLLTGEGHFDWLSGCSFHPDGLKLATTSGDATVRLWDFSRGCCVLTLSGHAQPTWACSFHSCGHFLASCSADRTAKLWDLNSQRCRLTLRRHTASVNSVCFLPSFNLLLTCSADKTLALWDARLGVCTTTFLGHRHPCNHAAFSSSTSMVASCDSSGIINLWDTRKPTSPMAAADTGPLSANQVAFNHSGKTLVVASSDGLVKLVEVDSGSVSSLEGHKDSVQSVTFDHKGETVISAGSDGRVNIWS